MIGGEDGVAVVPRARLREVAEGAEAFLGEAVAWQAGIDEGRTWFDVLGLKATIDVLGIPEADRAG